MSRIVDEYVERGRSLSDAVAALKELNTSPVLCEDVAQAIKRKMYSHVKDEPAAAIVLLEALMDEDILPFHQVVHEKTYLSFLEKIIARRGTEEKALVRLLTKWVQHFQKDADIFPNFAIFYARLVEQGFAEARILEEPSADRPLPVAADHVMDQYLMNQAEGQDPEEFKVEVAQTIKLFTDVFNAIVADIRNDNADRREALISLAANLDRYSEQFGLWIEQLDPGEYMEEAMHLNDQVTDALQKYKLLRSGALDEESEDSSSDDSS